MKKLVMASGNKGKILEAKDILNEYDVVSIKDLNIDIDVEEDKDTFEKNASKKAEELAKVIKKDIVIADDSGLEVEILDGFPGVRTKRWFNGTDRERNLALIEKLNGMPKEKRKAKAVTSMAASNGEKTISVVAYVDGFITEKPRGENGFGFDEIFEIENGKTLAELSEVEKNEISARKKSLELLKEKLKELD